MRALQPLHGHGAGDRSDAEDLLGVEQRQHAHRLHRLGAVDQGEAFLRLQHHRLEPRPAQRLAAGEPLATEERLALADQDQRQVGQRSEIAARADRALLRHEGDHVALEHRDEQVQRALADPAVSSGEDVRAQKHQRAHGRGRQRGARACGVGEDQVALQLAQIGARDGHLGQGAEARVHPVGRDTALGDPIHQTAPGPHALARRCRDLDAGASRRCRGHLLERQGAAVDDDPHERLVPSAAASRRQIGRRCVSGPGRDVLAR